MVLPNGFTNNLDSRLTRYLSTIRGNSGDPQPPMADMTAIKTIFIGYQNRDRKTVANIHDDAIEKGLIVEWVDADGRERVGVTQEGFEALPDQTHYDEADVEALQAIAEVEYQRHEPDQDIVAWVNGWINWIGEQTEADEVDEETTNE